MASSTGSGKSPVGNKTGRGKSLEAFERSKGSANCLEDMRAQSPPRLTTVGDYQDLYRTWMEMHPSALENFELFLEVAKGKRLAVFLDYDGTLSPIVDDPEQAIMSEAMRSAVREVAEHFPTAIISGRGREKVFGFVQLEQLFYAGSHGMDIMLPARRDGHLSTSVNGTTWTDAEGKQIVAFQPASEFIPMMEEVFKELREKTKVVQGALVENNKFCLTVHFRRVEHELWPELAEIVSSVMASFPKLKTTHGRKVLEIRPTVNWDKGKAVAYLLNTLGLESKEEVLPLYIGDDRTDEDAFKVLKERGCGLGIVVSREAKKTDATFSLVNPSEVMKFLHKLVEHHSAFLCHSVDGAEEQNPK